MNLVYYPDPILSVVSEPVQDFGWTTDLATEMLDLMDTHGGIGLAAPQVGINKRLFVAHIANDTIVAVNPTIITSGEVKYIDEGCLSIPNVILQISRPSIVELRAFDVFGKPFELVLYDLDAAVVQHEFDHISGITILDKVSRQMKKNSLRKYRV